MAFPVQIPESRGWRASAILIALGLVAAGCSLHDVDSDVTAPVDPLDRFPSEANVGLAADQLAGDRATSWWSEFNDSGLAKMIDRALSTNLTASDFAARVVAARAIARQSGAERRPALDATGSAGLASFDEDGIGEAISGMRFQGDVGLLVSWEVDVFGRLRSRERAAVFDAMAAQDDLDAVLLAVSADVARAYYAAAEQRLLLELLEQQIERDATLLELIELRFTQGEATGLDILRQRAQLADAQSLVPEAKTALRDAENTLDALAGTPADGQDEVLAGFPDLPEVPAAGVPADLLMNRPDLRAAQRRLVAVDFRIGEAIADRLPRFNIVGSLAYADAQDGTGFAASAIAGLFAPLVDWGRREAVVDQRRAEYASLLAEFTSLYVNAIAEVDTLLYAEQRTREQVAVLTDRVDLLNRAVVEARNRYVNGIGDYTDVLVALDDLQETQRELLAAEGRLVQQRIEVYRSVGGAIGDPNTTLDSRILDRDSEARS